MKFGRGSQSTTPQPAFDRKTDSPHRAKATPEACQEDYKAGKEARENLGKPAS